MGMVSKIKFEHLDSCKDGSTWYTVDKTGISNLGDFVSSLLNRAEETRECGSIWYKNKHIFFYEKGYVEYKNPELVGEISKFAWEDVTIKAHVKPSVNDGVYYIIEADAYAISKQETQKTEYEKLIDALNSICFHNCYGDIVKATIWHIRKHESDANVPFPNDDVFGDSSDYKNATNIIWMLCVLMYGEYGVSPALGWVEDKAGAIAFLEKLIEGWPKE